MEDFWNLRYAAQEYAYGANPNEFFEQSINNISVGKMLLPADGEGRNAVYAAKLGWMVQAIDMSEKGKEKALRLAAENNVKINYEVADLSMYQFPENEYDAAALVFAHFPAHVRKTIHQNVAKSLKPGGLLIVEAFGKKQIENKSGGPRAIEMLYTLEDLLIDFENLEIIESLETTTILNEGEFHKGRADVIRIKAIKSNILQ